MRKLSFLSAVACASLAVVAACGSSNRNTPAGDAGVGSGDGSLGDAGFGRDGSSPFGECARDTQAAQRLPLDLYLMVDSSGSMNETAAGATSKWNGVTTALTAFIDDPLSAGLGVGLQFFPLVKSSAPSACSDDPSCGSANAGKCGHPRACNNVTGSLKICMTDNECGGGAGSCALMGLCSNAFASLCVTASNCPPGGSCTPTSQGYCTDRDSCSASEYAAPQVPIATLPGGSSALKAELGSRSVDGFTPTSAALRGAIDAAIAHKAKQSQHTVAVVLTTDGFPTECAPTDIASIADIAEQGANAGIQTFVIGIFSPVEETQARANLDQIAAKGGSGQAFIITTQQNVAQVFQQALATIRGDALPCEYTLPVPKEGEPDYTKVNVLYTAGDGSDNVIKGVDDADACDPKNGGWYYDVDPSGGEKPTKVIVCPKTCDTFRDDPEGKVDVVQGCATVIK